MDREVFGCQEILDGVVNVSQLFIALRAVYHLCEGRSKIGGRGDAKVLVIIIFFKFWLVLCGRVLYI